MPRMTYKEAAKLIGRKGRTNFGAMQIQVEVLDVREVFGRTDLQVRPIAGTGTGWISLDSITLTA